MTVSVEKFGKDHWSTFAYLECRVVDNKGVVALPQMRCDIDRHPGLHASIHGTTLKKYPTILAGGEELHDHDDWDCVDDLEAAGFVEQTGTGINPAVRLTELGHEVAAALRKHKGEGGSFATFQRAKEA